MTVLDSFPSLIVLTVSVDVKQHKQKKKTMLRAQELCESPGGRPGSLGLLGLLGLCGRNATLNLNTADKPVVLVAAALAEC